MDKYKNLDLDSLAILIETIKRPSSARIAWLWAARLAHRLHPEIQMEADETYLSYRFQQLVREVGMMDATPGSPDDKIVKACRAAQFVGAGMTLSTVAIYCLSSLQGTPDLEQEEERMRNDILQAIDLLPKN